jgi:hypothetical protein
LKSISNINGNKTVAHFDEKTVTSFNMQVRLTDGWLSNSAVCRFLKRIGDMYLKHALLVISMLTLSANTVLADQIDGNWCSRDGRSISIDGPDVTTSRGIAVKAAYNRHHINFVIPSGEPNEGGSFQADQLNDNEIRVIIVRQSGGPVGEAEIWTPCKPVS